MERPNTSFKTGVLAATALVLAIGSAFAETPAPTNGKPGYHTENFRIRPSLSITQNYNSNVFTTDRHTRSDWITLASPTIKIDSTWSEHSLRMQAGAESGTYWEYDREDYLDYWGSTEGRYDIGVDTHLFAGLGYHYGHEGRDAPDSPAGQLEPTTYRSIDANAGVKTTLGDTSYRMGGTYETLDFDSTPAVSRRIINDDRDRKVTGLGIRATHRLDEKNRIFAQAMYEERDYDLNTDQFGFKRSSDGYRTAVGLIREWGKDRKLEAYLGIIHQDYEDSRFGNISKPDFGGRVNIALDNGSKVTMKLQRSLDETTEIGSPGYLNTALSGSLEYRISPRLTPYLSLGYSYYDFLETGRADKTYSASAGLKYFVTRNAHVVLGAGHRSRDSNDKDLTFDSNDFDETTVFLNFTARLYPLF